MRSFENPKKVNNDRSPQSNQLPIVQQKSTIHDSRPESLNLQNLQQKVNNSPQALQQKSWQEQANNSSRIVAQRQQLENINASPVQKVANKTGMPDQLKSGIENLSGMDMSDIRVHYNSPKPATLQAHAYAQGTDIHLAPGQEKTPAS